MPLRNSLVTFIVCVVLGSVTRADTIFVNNASGSDRNSGGTPENSGEGDGPLRTLAAALKRVQRGDKIELAKTEAPYQECVTLQGRRHSGTSYDPFVIDGNGATLEGIETVPAHRWEHVSGDIFRFVPDRTGYQQLFLDGSPVKRLPKIDSMFNTSFLPAKHWCRCKGGIHFATERQKSVHSYDLAYAKHRVGITLYDVENVVIHNLHVRGFQLDGINAHDNAFECVLSDVTSTENGRSGVSVGGSSRLHLTKCTMKENVDSQLRAEGWSTTNLHGTKLVSNETPAWKRETNQYRRGARLMIDGVNQIDIVGWWTEEDDEDDFLKRGLDRLEEEADAAKVRGPILNPAQPARRNPLEEVADEMPNDAADAADRADEEPIFEDEVAAPATEEDADPLDDVNPFGDVEDEPGGDEPPPADDTGDLFEDFGGDMEDAGDLFE